MERKLSLLDAYTQIPKRIGVMSMTREEEINVAVSKYIEDNSMTDGYISISDHKDSFIEGADWADSHPVNVWHDANEKPHAKKWLLVQLDKDDYKILCLKDLYIDLWCDWCKIFNFIRWAYIEDLLPK